MFILGVRYKSDEGSERLNYFLEHIEKNMAFNQPDTTSRKIFSTVDTEQVSSDHTTCSVLTALDRLSSRS